MEDWTADSDEPKQLSIDRMRGCDLCILLVAARRGHRPEHESLSITQMEYQEAVRLRIDVLAFLYDGESAWPPQYYELDKDEELIRWRADLKEQANCDAILSPRRYFPVALLELKPVHDSSSVSLPALRI